MLSQVPSCPGIPGLTRWLHTKAPGLEEVHPGGPRLTWDMLTTSNQRRIPGSLYAVTKEVLSIHMDCVGTEGEREGKHHLGNMGTRHTFQGPSRPPASYPPEIRTGIAKPKNTLTSPLGILSQRVV